MLLLQTYFSPLFFKEGTTSPEGQQEDFEKGKAREQIPPTPKCVWGGANAAAGAREQRLPKQVYDRLHHIVMCARLPLSFHFITDNSVQKPFVKTVTVPGRIPVLRECT